MPSQALAETLNAISANPTASIKDNCHLINTIKSNQLKVICKKQMEYVEFHIKE